MKIKKQTYSDPHKIRSIIKPLSALLLTSCLIWPHPSISSSDLPDLGSPASLILSSHDEEQLARSVVAELSQALKLSQDPVLNDYLHAIGYRIVATHRSSPESYTFFAVEDNSINAFAVPGGMIGVNTGLVLAAGSESELAGVMAHEVAHVHLKHIARFIEHMGKVRLSNIAGVVASIILATQNPQAGSGALAATMAGSTQSLINFTRENEKEADLVGIQSLAAAGFDPRGMSQFFKKLSQSTRYYGSDIPEYLRTHPLTESRLMEASRRAQAYPYKQVQDSLQFHLVQARIRVSLDPPKVAVSKFEEMLQNKTYLNEQGAKYGYALALSRAGDKRAKQVFESLIEQNPNQSLYRLDYAQLLWDQGKKDKATNILATALENHPHNHPMTMGLAYMQIEQNNPQQAITLLHSHSLYRSKAPEIYHLLSKAYAKNNDLVSSHRMEAEYRYYLGDLRGSLTQLRMAKQFAGSDSTQNKRILARKTEIETILAREASR